MVCMNSIEETHKEYLGYIGSYPAREVFNDQLANMLMNKVRCLVFFFCNKNLLNVIRMNKNFSNGLNHFNHDFL